MPEKKESALLLLTRAWARVRSSFGKVYKALHHASNLIMAVKIVPLEDDNGDVAREIEHLQECDCPNVVRYHGSFVHEDRLWILMEFCEGSSLLDIMAATGRCLTEMQVAAALSGCVEALLYLHARSKVHRDVKAGNLLLSSDGVVKLADFGVAASIENSSRRKTVIGTPFWMAPEVITCRRGPGGGSSAGYDQLADVWSLGITAIELAEGQPPHSSVSPLTAIFLIPTKPAPSLTEPEHWSAAFAQFVSACLVKEPQGRADSPSLHRHPFIIGGGRAVKDGVLRALMAASREPLRAFRDKSAAKNAAGPRAHAAAADGTVKDLKEIGDHQYGGTLNPSSPNRRGGVEPPRDSKRSSFGDRAGREPPGPNGSFTLPRACNSPQARRADAERLSNGDRDRAPPSPLASACWGAGDGRTEASKIDFEAIQSVARLLSGGGGGGGGLAALGAAVQAGAAGAATGSALAALPLTLRSGMHSGGCERTARLVLPVAACVCCDGVVAARCAALVLVAGRSAASLSVAQLAAAAATVALVSLSSPATAGPSAAVGAAAALLGLAPSADDLALLGAIEVATRPAAAAASTLGGCLAAAVAGRAGPWERSGVASGAAGIPDDEDPLSS